MSSIAKYANKLLLSGAVGVIAVLLSDQVIERFLWTTHSTDIENEDGDDLLEWFSSFLVFVTAFLASLLVLVWRDTRR